MADINNIFSDIQVDMSVPKPTKVGRAQQRIQTFALAPKFPSMEELLTALSGAVASPEILAHLEVMLCVQNEDLYRAVYSPAFRSNSTKYLGVTFKVCDKEKLPHEPGFWLDDINNAAMDDAPSDSETSETEFLQQRAGDTDSDSVDEDDDDDYLDLWHPVEGFEELEHR
ncbi:hypothetical protein FACUT_13915 [Fusarium acutatum]|uniref:Uncharacterized protein n=1 Tax=Fusarium acutatum TaxID=78861 RepID=A0A8H4JAV8_9HYPO|nr:hypothetical protein FACUT_13915 [Fusarium acutatum]